MLAHKIHQRIWGICHSVFQVSFQQLIALLNVLSSDFQTLGGVVQTKISYQNLQELTQIQSSDFLVVFFFSVQYLQALNALCTCPGNGIAPRNDQCIFRVVILKVIGGRLFSWHKNLQN